MTSVPRENRPFAHIVLHYLDGIGIANLDVADLIKRNRVPVTDETQLFLSVVIEEGCFGRLAPR